MTGTSARTQPRWWDTLVLAKELRRLVTVLVVAGAGAYLWYGWCVFPLSDWNELRLAPAFALRHGLTVYPLADGGPLGTWIYGPVPLLINLPATYAPSATSAVLVAGAINLLTLVLPLMLVCLFVPTWPVRLTALALCILLLPPRSLAFQVADHAAIAFGLLGSWFLVRTPALARRDLMAAAACTVLAASSKQTAVFLFVGHGLYLARARQRGSMWTFVIGFAGFGLLAALGAAAWFGGAELWLNLVQIPARLPWGDVTQKMATRWPQLIAYVAAPLVLLGAAWRRRERSAASTPARRLFHCAALTFLVLLPPGLISFFKIGGDTNVLHSSYYLIPAAVVAIFATSTGGGVSPARTLLMAIAALALRIPDLAELPAKPLTRTLLEAQQLAQVAPGTAWFPSHPLVTYYSDGRLYHVEDGLATRHLAGMSITEDGFRRYLPVRLSTVVTPASDPSPFALQLLTNFSQVTRLERWTLHQKPAMPQPNRPLVAP